MNWLYCSYKVWSKSDRWLHEIQELVWGCGELPSGVHQYEELFIVTQFRLENNKITFIIFSYLKGGDEV